MRSLKELLNYVPQSGRVDWIGVRPARGEAMRVMEAVAVTPAGIAGDRYAGRSGRRHVTIMQAEHVAVIASVLGLDRIPPAAFRRNLLVSGINVLALKDKTIAVGDVVLEVTGACHPCSRMETILGAGGYSAMRGHGGVTARVVTPGRIAVGDRVRVRASAQAEQ